MLKNILVSWTNDITVSNLTMSLLSGKNLEFTTPFLRRGILYLGVSVTLFLIWLGLRFILKEE